MLHLAGLLVNDIFATLTVPVVPSGQPLLDDQENVVKKQGDHFVCKPNTALEKHLFGKGLNAKERLCGAQFLHCLQEQAALCEFEDWTVSEHLKVEAVEQARDERLRRKLLEKEALTLQMAGEAVRFDANQRPGNAFGT